MQYKPGHQRVCSVMLLTLPQGFLDRVPTKPAATRSTKTSSESITLKLTLTPYGHFSSTFQKLKSPTLELTNTFNSGSCYHNDFKPVVFSVIWQSAIQQRVNSLRDRASTLFRKKGETRTHTHTHALARARTHTDTHTHTH